MTMDITKTESLSGPNNQQSTNMVGGNNNNNNNNNNMGNGNQLCAGCGKHIQDRFLLRALDLLWHEDCLKCGCCDCRLGEVGSTLYTKGNLMLCKRDYLRLFGNTGFCAACNKIIPAFEMVMRARNNVYHLECFACQQCNHRFCVGDRFYLCENKILCEYDYEERLVFASMANHPMIKRHVNNINTTNQNTGHQSSVGHNIITGGGQQGQQTIMSGQRQTGDHNNNSNNNNNNNTNNTSNSGINSPFGTPTHMKTTLGTSS